jgi:IS4 transposase
VERPLQLEDIGLIPRISEALFKQLAMAPEVAMSDRTSVKNRSESHRKPMNHRITTEYPQNL